MDTAIDGRIDIEKAEQNWRFTPAKPWPAEKLRLVVDSTLEDVAGNNFHDLLDHVAGQDESDAASPVLLINTRNCTG